MQTQKIKEFIIVSANISSKRAREIENWNKMMAKLKSLLNHRKRNFSIILSNRMSKRVQVFLMNKEKLKAQRILKI